MSRYILHRWPNEPDKDKAFCIVWFTSARSDLELQLPRFVPSSTQICISISLLIIKNHPLICFSLYLWMATTKIFATQILAIPPGSAQTVLNQGPEQSKPGPARAEQGHWSSSEYLVPTRYGPAGSRRQGHRGAGRWWASRHRHARAPSRVDPHY